LGKMKKKKKHHMLFQSH